MFTPGDRIATVMECNIKMGFVVEPPPGNNLFPNNQDNSWVKLSHKEKPLYLSNFSLAKFEDIVNQVSPLEAIRQECQIEIKEYKHEPFQSRVREWIIKCFGSWIAYDKTERNHRYFEESTELVQSLGMTRSECHQMVDYTFDRPVGEPTQELGGVMVTLAALANAHCLSMNISGEVELRRINSSEVMEKIRVKQLNKPKHSPLPE